MPEIRPLKSDDRAQWDLLWQGYLHFYSQRVPLEVTELTFARLIDETAQPHGLVAVVGGKLVGLVHYLFHPSTWSLTDICYLEDLFVDPAARRAGVARALIHAVYGAADRVNAGSVYWMTQDFNADGRALYDAVAHRTAFIRYER